MGKNVTKKVIKKTPKMPFKDKYKYVFKQMIAIILAALVVIIHPVVDAYYYIVAIISLAIIVISFKDLVKEHNMLTTNKLPQLEKRGGDERE